jgi:hypothetical protein
MENGFHEAGQGWGAKNWPNRPLALQCPSLLSPRTVHCGSKECHCVQAALRTTDALKPGSDTKLDAQILEDIAEDAPSVSLSREQAVQPLVDVMVAAGMQGSKGAARR